MATKTPVRPGLFDEQLGELMGLLGGSDSVELKLTVPAAQQRAAIGGLGLDALDAQIRGLRIARAVLSTAVAAYLPRGRDGQLGRMTWSRQVALRDQPRRAIG